MSAGNPEIQDLEVVEQFVTLLLPGIKGIESTRMGYASWFLLNEALRCYQTGNYVASILTLAASVEEMLRKQTACDQDAGLQIVARKGLETRLITQDEFEQLDHLRLIRNKYVHYSPEELPGLKGMKLVPRQSPFSHGEPVPESWLRDAQLQEMFPLLFNAPFMSYEFFEKVIQLCRRLFPSSGRRHGIVRMVKVRSEEEIDELAKKYGIPIPSDQEPKQGEKGHSS